MKKVGCLYREKIIEQITGSWNDSDACILFTFDKLSAFAFNKLRNVLHNNDARVIVSKNTLIEKAAHEKNAALSVAEHCDGSVGLVFAQSQRLVDVCKTLVDFSNESKALFLKAGFLKEKQITAKDIDAISSLPSRDILLGTAIMTMIAPLSGFVFTLNNIILKFLWLVEEIKKKKS